LKLASCYLKINECQSIFKFGGRMKKHFLGRNKLFLMGGIAILFIIGSAVIACLRGPLPSFAQSAVSLSHRWCYNTGGLVHGLINTNAVCSGQVEILGRGRNSLSNTPVPVKDSSIQPTATPSAKPTPSGIQTGPTAKPTPGGIQTGSTAKPTPGGIQTDSTTDTTKAVFNQINTSRAEAGLPALQWSSLLVNSAHKHNLAMQAANQLSHQLSNEANLGSRVSQAGVQWSSVGENIGYSSDYLHPTNAATGLNQDMLNEQPPNDGHRRNMLSKDFTIVGIDVFIDTTNHKVWLTEDFARPA
jgi:uncharacterized protein YkwD